MVLEAVVDGYGQLLDSMAQTLEDEVADDVSVRNGHEAVTQPMIAAANLSACWWLIPLHAPWNRDARLSAESSA